MAKLRHVAVAVPDPEKTAQFYIKSLGMKEVGRTDSPLATEVYLPDGVVCLALLKYKTDAAAGADRGKNYVGVHHIGFWVDDVATQADRRERRCILYGFAGREGVSLLRDEVPRPRWRNP